MAVQKQDKIRPCYDYGSFFVLRHCAYGVILRTDLRRTSLVKAIVTLVSLNVRLQVLFSPLGKSRRRVLSFGFTKILSTSCGSMNVGCGYE